MVSLIIGQDNMFSSVRFCVLLPILQFILGGVLGGVGLWQRGQILNQPIFGSPASATTAVYHVWPWPFKLAVLINEPAVILGGLTALTMEWLGSGMSEPIEFGLMLVFVPPLWYWIGLRLDAINRKIGWVMLATFSATCVLLAVVRIGYVSFVPIGFLVWLLGIRQLFKLKPR